MARKLAYSVNVAEYEPIDPDRPEFGSTIVRQEFFLAGSTLPAWAAKLVGDHVYGENEEESAAPVDEDDEETPNYSEFTVSELRDEIDGRNIDREDKLPTKGNKSDLIAILEDDDKK